MPVIETTALRRHYTTPVEVVWKDARVVIGGGRPVVVQSMTNTATADVEATYAQASELASAGSELVRLTVNTPEAARAVPEIRARLDAAGLFVPLVGDFHYNGHKLLTEIPECAAALSKYRINPGNVGKGSRQEENFALMIEAAKKWGAAVRIGVNGGSLDQALLGRLMDENLKSGGLLTPQAVLRKALVESAVQSTALCFPARFPRFRNSLPFIAISRSALPGRFIWGLPKPGSEARGSSPQRPLSPSCLKKESATRSAFP